MKSNQSETASPNIESSVKNMVKFSIDKPMSPKAHHNNYEESEMDVSNLDMADEIPENKRDRIFIFFLLANLFLNYDTGVIPASLLEIIKEVPLDFSEQALIGSLVYLGLSFASLFVSIFFNKFGAKNVCATVLLLNSLCCFLFSYSKIKYILYASRFMMGVFESFIIIYGPVWVNNFSPPEHSTKWMGILHSSSAIGVMIGYLTAGVTINFFNDYVTWRFSIQIQGFIQIPISLYFYFEDEEFINIETTNDERTIDQIRKSMVESYAYSERKNRQSHVIPSNRPSNVFNRAAIKTEVSSPVHNKEVFESPRLGAKEKRKNIASVELTKQIRSEATRIDAIEINHLEMYCNQTLEVVSNWLYIWVSLALCSMYFISSGIQFWMTSYLIDILDNDPFKVVIIFSIVSITGPLFGVIVGGTFADKYGGYKGKNILKALKLCSAFGVVSFVFAFPIGYLYSMTYISVLLWAFLFFGAAIVPIGTGIMVSSVRKECQATSSSISQLVFNLFGYFLSPYLTGHIMDSFSNRKEGYKWGIRVIFWWSIFGVIFMSLAWIHAYRKFTNSNTEKKSLVDIENDEMNQTMAELVYSFV